MRRLLELFDYTLEHLRLWPVRPEPLSTLLSQEVHAVQNGFIAVDTEYSGSIDGTAMVARPPAGGQRHVRLPGKKLILEIGRRNRFDTPEFELRS